MKVNIRKSILTTVLVASSFAAAMASAVALNNNRDHNSIQPESIAAPLSNNNRESDELILWSPWAPGGVQDVAFRQIVDAYNDEVGSIEGGKRVKVVNMTTGYNGITETIQQDILAGKEGIKQLPDIYITYSDAAASLLTYSQYSGMGDTSYALNLDDEDLATAGISDDIIASIGASNELLVGGEEGATYTIPFATSSELMGIDSPLLVWMLQQYEKQGGIVNISGDIMAQVLDAVDGSRDGVIDGDTTQAIYAPFAPDGSDIITDLSIDAVTIQETDKLAGEIGIEAYWQNNGTDVTGSTITITDETFESAESMMNLANELLRVVSPTDGNLQNKSSQAIIAYDSAPNNFYTYAQSVLDPLNTDKWLIEKDGDKTRYNFTHTGTEQEQVALDIFEFFNEGFENGAIWVPNNGVIYGSNLIVNHQTVFSIGSTAGPTHYYNTYDSANKGHGADGTLGSGEVVFLNSPGKLKEESEINVQMQQGPSIGAVDKTAIGDSSNNEAIAVFLNWLIDPETKVSLPTTIKSSYITSPDSLQAAIDAETVVDNSVGHYEIANVAPTPWEADGTTLTDPTVTADDAYNTRYWVAKDAEGNELGTVEKIDGTVTATGLYWQEYSKKPELYADGQAVQYSTLGTEAEQAPSVFMSQQSNYIVGTQSTWNDTDYVNSLTDEKLQASGTWSGDKFTTNSTEYSVFKNSNLIGPSFAYKNINDANEGTNGAQLEMEPYSVSTSQVRTLVGDEIYQNKTYAVNGAEMLSAEEVLAEISTEIAKNGWDDQANTTFVWEWWMTLIIILLVLIVVGAIAGIVVTLVKKNKSSKSEVI